MWLKPLICERQNFSTDAENFGVVLPCRRDGQDYRGNKDIHSKPAKCRQLYLLHGKSKNVESAAFSSTFEKNSHKKVSSTLRKNVELMLNCEAFQPDGCINTIKGLPYFVRKPLFRYNILCFYKAFVSIYCILRK